MAWHTAPSKVSVGVTLTSALCEARSGHQTLSEARKAPVMKRLLLVGSILVLSALQAHAGWSVTVRAKCRSWSRQYVAKAHTGCGILLLCAQTSSSCGTAYASCSKSCAVGGANANSFCGPSGWGGSSNATGTGFAGLEGIDGATEASASQNHLEGSVIFDEAAGTVVLLVNEGEFEAAADGSFSEMEVIVSMQSGSEADPVDDVRAQISPESILWQGAMRVEKNSIIYAGELGADDLNPSTERTATGTTLVRTQRVARTITLPAGVNLDEVEVTIRGDSGFANRVQPTYTTYLRGDVNTDGGVDLGDAIAGLNYLFRGSRAPTCMDAADANGIGGFDLSDPIFTLSWFFLGGPQPPAPGPFECGPHPGGRSRGCESYDVCGSKPTGEV